MEQITRQRGSFTLRLVIGLALLAFVIWHLDTAVLLGSLTNLSWLPLLLAFAAQVAQRVLWALRWRAILRANGIERAWRELLRLVMIGLFFDSFIPTAIGGDLVRGYYAARGKERILISYLVVAIERLLGAISFAALVALAATVALLSGQQRLPLGLLNVAAVIGWAILVPGVVLFAWRGWHAWIAILPWLGRRSEKVLYSLNLFRRPETPRFLIVGTSVMLKLLAVLFFIACVRAVGLDTPALLFFLIVPVALLTSAMPVTLNGLGVREGAFVALLAGAGVPPAEAGAAALLALAFNTAFALAGGLIYLGYRPFKTDEPGGQGGAVTSDSLI